MLSRKVLCIFTFLLATAIHAKHGKRRYVHYKKGMEYVSWRKAHMKRAKYEKSTTESPISEEDEGIGFRMLPIPPVLTGLQKIPDAEEVCYDRLGCFSNNFPFYVPEVRPFPLPQNPEKIGTKFHFYNRRSLKDGAVLLPSPLAKVPSGFESNLQTIFIIHGFLHSAERQYMQNIKDSVLSSVDVNLIMVDWGASSTFPYYNCGSNIRVVGKQAAALAEDLRKAGARSDFWCIGHSLGAQTCGFFGKAYGGLKRITGLDAASPGFELPYREVHLDYQDAEFVDVHHTAASQLGLGTMRPLGHVDFYYNGGEIQPGCHLLDTALGGKDKFAEEKDSRLSHILHREFEYKLGCSHLFATFYFAEAMKNRNCTIWGRTNYYDPRVGCQLDTCIPVGLETPLYPYRGAVNVTTNSSGEPPYCVYSPRDDASMRIEMKNASAVAKIRSKLNQEMQKNRQEAEEKQKKNLAFGRHASLLPQVLLSAVNPMG